MAVIPDFTLPSNCTHTLPSQLHTYWRASTRISLQVPTITLGFIYSNQLTTETNPPSLGTFSQHLISPVLFAVCSDSPKYSNIDTALVSSMLPTGHN